MTSRLCVCCDVTIDFSSSPLSLWSSPPVLWPVKASSPPCHPKRVTSVYKASRCPAAAVALLLLHRHARAEGAVSGRVGGGGGGGAAAEGRRLLHQRGHPPGAEHPPDTAGRLHTEGAGGYRAGLHGVHQG